MSDEMELDTVSDELNDAEFGGDNSRDYSRHPTVNTQPRKPKNARQGVATRRGK